MQVTTALDSMPLPAGLWRVLLPAGGHLAGCAAKLIVFDVARLLVMIAQMKRGIISKDAQAIRDRFGRVNQARATLPLAFLCGMGTVGICKLQKLLLVIIIRAVEGIKTWIELDLISWESVRRRPVPHGFGRNYRGTPKSG
jgi:hypothetical protein